MPSVSVIVPTYNRRHLLVGCLEAMPRDVQVIVVDDGSSDGTRAAVQSVDHPNLHYLRQANGGPASARNSGVAVASGEYVAFTDDDCVPTGSWPWPLVNRLANSSTSVAGIGGHVLPANSGLFSRYYTFHRILEPPPNCAYVVTANCTYRKEVLVEVGGFDSTIKHAGGEDPALSAAVRAAGYSLGYEPSAVVLHEYRESLWDFLKTSIDTARGAQMSWTPELTPQSVKPDVLIFDLRADWRSYREAGLRVQDRLAFLCLRLLQRLAYRVGWTLERRRTLRHIKLRQHILGRGDAPEDTGMH